MPRENSSNRFTWDTWREFSEYVPPPAEAPPPEGVYTYEPKLKGEHTPTPALCKIAKKVFAMTNLDNRKGWERSALKANLCVIEWLATYGKEDLLSIIENRERDRRASIVRFAKNERVIMDYVVDSRFDETGYEDEQDDDDEDNF